jgi:glutathione S-transferase
MDRPMQLFFNRTSPYARKARVAVFELGLEQQVTFVEVDPWAEPAELVTVAPLSKVPALLLGDRELITESDTILQVLDTLAPNGQLFPATPAQRRDGLARAAFCQGLIDASFITVIEARRPEPLRWSDWVMRQERAIARALSFVDASFALAPGRFDAGDISLACALAYLDFRLPHIEWRELHPRLAQWLDDASARPSMIATRPT